MTPKFHNATENEIHSTYTLVEEGGKFRVYDVYTGVFNWADHVFAKCRVTVNGSSFPAFVDSYYADHRERYEFFRFDEDSGMSRMFFPNTEVTLEYNGETIKVFNGEDTSNRESDSWMIPIEDDVW